MGFKRRTVLQGPAHALADIRLRPTGRESDALRFAAGARRDGTVQRQIPEADFDQEFQALDDFRPAVARGGSPYGKPVINALT